MSQCVLVAGFMSICSQFEDSVFGLITLSHIAGVRKPRSAFAHFDRRLDPLVATASHNDRLLCYILKIMSLKVSFQVVK